MSGALYQGKKAKKGAVSTLKRSTISKRKPPNRHSFEKESELTSTLAKKMKTTASDVDIELDATFGYRFVNFIPVFAALSRILVCKECGNNVNFSETSKRGLGFKIVVSCGTCRDTHITNSPLIENAYDINRRLIFAMRLLGIGQNGISKFCALMSLPMPVYQSTYDSIVKLIATAANAVRTKSTKKAAEEEKSVAAGKGQTTGLTVAGDGSWRKGSFSSLFGFVTLIGKHTGKVLDVLVKSKDCESCERWNGKHDAAEYEEWAAQHESVCQTNTIESAGKIEVDAFLEMFRRSEDLYGTRYAFYVADGDSKTYRGIVDGKPYDSVVGEKESVEHVRKRVGTRLRSLKKQAKNLGGRGQLAGKLIDELSVYYGLAIRRNCDSIEAMQNDIWATLYHKISTDENPQHEKCPNGPDSWCTWQRAAAANTLNVYSHKPPMSTEVFNAVQKIYIELTAEDLLSKCLGGYAQRSNQNFNSVVWTIAPTSVSSGKKIIDIATDVAAVIFNEGFKGLLEVMTVLGLKISYEGYNFCHKIDEHRAKGAERSLARSMKDARNDLASVRKETEEHNLNLDGMLYGPGIAE